MSDLLFESGTKVTRKSCYSMTYDPRYQEKDTMFGLGSSIHQVSSTIITRAMMMSDNKDQEAQS